jgi:hypothetical protein
MIFMTRSIEWPEPKKHFLVFTEDDRVVCKTRSASEISKVYEAFFDEVSDMLSKALAMCEPYQPSGRDLKDSYVEVI